MAIVIPGDPAVKDTTKASYAASVNDALADLNSRLSVTESSLLPNGSFEFDIDVDGEPDLWTVTDSAGGTHAISDLNDSGGNAIHGAKSLQMITTGGGGFVEALSDNFIPCGEDSVIRSAGFYQRDTASIRIRAQILYYNFSETLIATDPLLDITDTGVAWNTYQGISIAPANAAFFKVKLIGGESGGAIAGNVYFDGIEAVAHAGDFVVGEYIWFYSGQSTLFATTAISATKIFEMIVPKGGDIRIVYTGSVGDGTMRTRIYRNGGAVGTLRSGTGIFTEDISGWTPGDKLQIYGYRVTGSVAVSKVKLKSTEGTSLDMGPVWLDGLDSV